MTGHEQHVLVYRGEAPPAMLVSELRASGLDVRLAGGGVEQRGLESLGQTVTNAAVEQGLEIIVFGAGYLVREVLERWRNRHPESPVEWREQDGYR